MLSPRAPHSHSPPHAHTPPFSRPSFPPPPQVSYSLKCTFAKTRNMCKDFLVWKKKAILDDSAVRMPLLVSTSHAKVAKFVALSQGDKPAQLGGLVVVSNPLVLDAALSGRCKDNPTVSAGSMTEP